MKETVQNMTQEEWERKLSNEFIFCRARSIVTGEVLKDNNGEYFCGFECNLGWYPLLYEMCKKILPILESCHYTERFYFLQVKQKYGTLRVYHNGLPSEIYEQIEDIIEMTEKQSAHICELCGEAGELRCTCGWYMTLCEDCLQDFGNGKEEEYEY